MVTKGIILAGGSGSRLYPLTQVVCKQLLPVYDKPMIYYPLSTLLLGGIKDILIISTPKDLPHIKQLLGDGSHLGISIQYKIQEHPRGIAEAFIIGEDFIGNESVCLILGDNIFHGNLNFLRNSILESLYHNVIFGYKVKDPERYGVVEFDSYNQVLSIEEKPLKPKSPFAVPGLYIYNNDVVEVCKNLRPSNRGELEITDVNKYYLEQKKLKVEILSRGTVWLDTGTQSSLLEASSYIAAIENRQGLKIGCIEEIAYNNSFITSDQFRSLIDKLPKTEYRHYLEGILK